MCGIWQRPHRPPLEPRRLASILADPDLSSALTHINITGGEPAEHPTFAEIGEVVSESCPSLVEVNVNLSGLDAELTIVAVERFRLALAARIAMIATVSLDGVNSTHDRIRGVKGAFHQTAEAIEGCMNISSRHQSLKVHVNCTVSKHNLDDVPNVIRWVREHHLTMSLTVAASNDLYLANVAQSHRFTLSTAQVRELAELLETLQSTEDFPATERHYYSMARRMLMGEPRSCACVYQTHGVFLDLDGTLYPCGTAPSLPYGRLPEQAFRDIYHGPHGEAVRQALLRRYCPSCPSNSYHGLAEGVWLEVLRNRRSTR